MDTIIDDERRIIKQIYRFKFSDEFVADLYRFSKLHQLDKRVDYKEAWTLWMQENDIHIQSECKRLNDQGYYGDILDKMYKSSRYYFRKKPVTKAEPKERRKYISCDQELLVAMDDHISKNCEVATFTPALGYDQFCNTHKQLLSDEIRNMMDNQITDKELILNKIKKTYKNRYFLFIKK